jgi:hypothetical protein
VYRPFGYSLPRLVRTRFNPFWPLVASITVARRARAVPAALDAFTPDAVVSVANGFLWFAAADYARRAGLPLHLFLHEDWPSLVTLERTGPLWGVVRAGCRRRVRPVFRRAASLFSVSPGMADEVRRVYGCESEVLYPNRGDDSPVPCVRVRRAGGPPVVAHAGFVHLRGNAELLRRLAAGLARAGGRLDLYTLHTDADLAKHGLAPPHVRRVGFFPAAEMAERVAETADAMVVTASFDPADRRHESTLFPSKLADYTAIGLPILVWGPEYSSAARWADDHPSAARLFTTPDAAPVLAAAVELTQHPETSRRLAEGAIAAGRRMFELAVARGQFQSAVRRSVGSHEGDR